MKDKKFILTVLLTFVLTFLTAVIVTLFWNLFIDKKGAIVDWETSVVLAIIIGIVSPIIQNQVK